MLFIFNFRGHRDLLIKVERNTTVLKGNFTELFLIKESFKWEKNQHIMFEKCFDSTQGAQKTKPQMTPERINFFYLELHRALKCIADMHEDTVLVKGSTVGCRRVVIFNGSGSFHKRNLIIFCSKNSLI